MTRAVLVHVVMMVAMDRMDFPDFLDLMELLVTQVQLDLVAKMATVDSLVSGGVAAKTL